MQQTQSNFPIFKNNNYNKKNIYNCEVNKNNLKIVNSVSVVEYGKQIDLNKVVLKMQNCEQKQRFPCIVARFLDPKGTALIFQTGKIIIIGCDSQQKSQQIADQVIKKIQKNQKESKKNKKIKEKEMKKHLQEEKCIKPQIEIKNLIATYNLGYEVGLESLEFYLQQNYQFNKEFLFKKSDVIKGITFTFSESKSKFTFKKTKHHKISSVIIKIFRTGKCTIMGAKEENQILTHLKTVKQILNEFNTISNCQHLNIKN
ncbi:hypothetical protein PPERSA_03104 [Pseudocohnilembus persalinus]|uniref:TATA-box binding protein n=1 Tax=Pseudocohnilembus persalinus TaxID=266149 RepID=A0A0V0QR07_PSEPJ|nr:hypothetical protein PPERSA_03104 [Pseudocohnilembus persalinus]|eukprot:KRX04713.1 hypothetical protein PPERSA_03104 [Pseudocohnilembus persalinus]